MREAVIKETRRSQFSREYAYFSYAAMPIHPTLEAVGGLGERAV